MSRFRSNWPGAATPSRRPRERCTGSGSGIGSGNIRVGLGHGVGHYPGQVSGGEQQRVAIARAFVAGPALLLADEPTGNLDRATGETVIDYLFGEHARLGSALLLITHDAALAERCERRLDLADGRIIGEHRVGEHR